MRQRSRGHCTLLVSGIERQGIIEAPIRGFEFRIDETNLQSLHRESYFLNFEFFKSLARSCARCPMMWLPFCAGIEFAEGSPQKRRINPALFSVVTSYPLGEFSSHASRVGFLRRGVSAAANHRSGALRVAGYVGISLRHKARVNPAALIKPNTRSHRSGVLVPQQKPASDGDSVHFRRRCCARALRVDTAAL